MGVGPQLGVSHAPPAALTETRGRAEGTHVPLEDREPGQPRTSPVSSAGSKALTPEEALAQHCSHPTVPPPRANRWDHRAAWGVHPPWPTGWLPSGLPWPSRNSGWQDMMPEAPWLFPHPWESSARPARRPLLRLEHRPPRPLPSEAVLSDRSRAARSPQGDWVPWGSVDRADGLL